MCIPGGWPHASSVIGVIFGHVLIVDIFWFISLADSSRFQSESQLTAVPGFGAQGLQSGAGSFSSTNDSEGGRIYSCDVLRGGEKRANDQIKTAKSLPFDPDTGWGILRVKFPPLDLFLCHLPAFLIMLFMGGGCVCQKHL